jgi:hypothetical protein
MKRSRMQQVYGLALACSLVFSAVSPVWADGAAAVQQSGSEEKLVKSAAIGRADIGGGSYMELKDVSILPGDDGNTAAFTLTIYNGGQTDLEFIDYWVRLQSKNGNQFTVNLLAKDKDKNRIPSATSQDFRFYSKLNSTTTLQDLEFKLIKWDFSLTNFERIVGQLTVPADYSYVTPADSKRIISISGVPFKMNIRRAAISQNDENYLPTIYMDMENNGTSGVKLPELQFYIHTKTGLIYPLQASAFSKDTAIQPLVKKEGVLTGTIPREVDPEGWKLVVTQSVAGTGGSESLALPMAFFELPAATTEDVSIGNDYHFSNKSGTYTARLTSLQRLPWEDQDILTATLSLINDGSKSLPIPELAAYLMLDDAVKVEAKTIRTDKVIGIAPGKEITLQIAGKIPYTYEFQGIKLFLQEKDADKTVDLLTFHHNTELMNMAVIPAKETKLYTDIGLKSAYKVREVHTFTGDAADVFAVQMDVDNQEKRFADVRKQVAQFKTEDGAVFPAKISEIKTKVTPGGKAALFMWATLPKGTKTTDIQLLLGDEVIIPSTDNKAEAKQDGYVNAVAFQLPVEDNEPKDSFTDLDLYPYTVSFSRFGTQANFENNTVTLEFDYELKRNPLVEANTSDHKVVVEIMDTLHNKKEITFSKTYDLEKADSAQSLKQGQHSIEWEAMKNEEIYNIESMKTYTLNIYHEYQGYKKLIASKELDWFVFSE